MTRILTDDLATRRDVLDIAKRWRLGDIGRGDADAHDVVVCQTSSLELTDGGPAMHLLRGGVLRVDIATTAEVFVTDGTCSVCGWQGQVAKMGGMHTLQWAASVCSPGCQRKMGEAAKRLERDGMVREVELG